MAPVMSAPWPKWLVASSLLLESALVLPLAFRERETASLLATIANEGWTEEARLATQAAQQAVTTVFWLHLVLGALLVLLATTIYVRPRQWMFGAAALAAVYLAASAVWFLLDAGPTLGRELPVGVLVVAVAASASVALASSLFGWEATAPTEPRRPASPPVPPSHQAG